MLARWNLGAWANLRSGLGACRRERADEEESVGLRARPDERQGLGLRGAQGLGSIRGYTQAVRLRRAPLAEPISRRAGTPKSRSRDGGEADGVVDRLPCVEPAVLRPHVQYPHDGRR